MIDLKKHTILLTVVGSRAYGINQEGSDIDVKGVAIPPQELLLGCVKPFEQADSESQLEVFSDLFSESERKIIESSKLEGTIYGLSKFMRLAMNCNPNVLDVLFCRNSDVKIETEIGMKLRQNRNLFLSMKARNSFLGYASSQLKNLRTKRQKSSNRFELVEKFGYDSKSGAHLYRLLSMGYEILTTGQVNVYRGEIDAEKLVAIRKGSMSIEELESWADEKISQIKSIKSSPLPDKPDVDRINRLCVELTKQFYRM